MMNLDRFAIRIAESMPNREVSFLSNSCQSRPLASMALDSRFQYPQKIRIANGRFRPAARRPAHASHHGSATNVGPRPCATDRPAASRSAPPKARHPTIVASSATTTNKP